MRVSNAISAAIPALAGSLLLACTPSPPPEPPAGGPGTLGPGGRAVVFSAERAWKDLETLAAAGSRVPGSEASSKARAYIREQLEGLGLTVTSRTLRISVPAAEAAEFEAVNLRAEIPGESSDLIVLAAPYDAAFSDSAVYPGVNDGASGAALVLELARVLSMSPLYYTVRLYFLDGEAQSGWGDYEGSGLFGSSAEARALVEQGEVKRVRLLVLFNRVSDADLQIARDRFSHRTHRNSIWAAAADLGHSEVFSPTSGFETPYAGHRAFIESGVRPSVAIVDPHLGDSDAPAGAQSEDDTLASSSAESLEIVGRVTLTGIEDIVARLRKIDRYSEIPTAADPQPSGPSTTPEAPDSAAKTASEAAPLPATDEAPGNESAPPPAP